MTELKTLEKVRDKKEVKEYINFIDEILEERLDPIYVGKILYERSVYLKERCREKNILFINYVDALLNLNNMTISRYIFMQYVSIDEFVSIENMYKGMRIFEIEEEIDFENGQIFDLIKFMYIFQNELIRNNIISNIDRGDQGGIDLIRKGIKKCIKNKEIKEILYKILKLNKDCANLKEREVKKIIEEIEETSRHKINKFNENIDMVNKVLKENGICVNPWKGRLRSLS